MTSQSLQLLRSLLLAALLYLTAACSQTTTQQQLATRQKPFTPPAQPYKIDQEDGQWQMPAKNYASTRFSGLSEINTGNVNNLKVAWTFSTGAVRGHEAAPIVVNNTMYIVTPYPNIVYALDLTQSGAVKWKYEPKPASQSQGVACCDVVNRGVTYSNGRIFFNTLDNNTIALDANTGQEIWKASLGDINKGPRAYVSNERDGTVTVIDTNSDRVVSTIDVGARPRGIRTSPDGKLVYVALSFSSQQTPGTINQIAAIDTERGEVVAKYDAGTDPEQFAVSADGGRLFISNEDAGTASIVDTTSGKILSTVVVGIEPEGVTISPDGRWVYVTAETSNTVSVIDTAKNDVVATFMVGARPRDAAFSPDGSRAYVTAELGRTLSVIDTRTHTVVRTIHLPSGDGVKPMGVVVSNDGEKVYVANGRANSVSVLDAHTDKLIATIPVGQRVWGLALTRDGKKLYAANGLSNDVSVIDTATNSVVATISAGDGPWGIAIVGF